MKGELFLLRSETGKAHIKVKEKTAVQMSSGSLVLMVFNETEIRYSGSHPKL